MFRNTMGPGLSASIVGALAFAGAVFVFSSSLPSPARSGEISLAREDVLDLPLATGHRQRVLFLTPAKPRAVIVMLPGGTGNVGISRDGAFRHDKNFLVRTRALWVENGYAVVLPDTVDHLNLRPLRASPAYGDLVDGLVRAAFRLTGRPVVLLGTSQGTIAATNGASRATENGPLAALVLTETIFLPGRKSTETVFDADLGEVRVPTLIVANERDRCDVAPPDAVDRIATAFTHARAVKVVMVDGGTGISDNPCSSLSPHGYAGIERMVVDDIVRWLAKQPRLRS